MDHLEQELDINANAATQEEDAILSSRLGSGSGSAPAFLSAPPIAAPHLIGGAHTYARARSLTHTKTPPSLRSRVFPLIGR